MLRVLLGADHLQDLVLQVLVVVVVLIGSLLLALVVIAADKVLVGKVRGLDAERDLAGGRVKREDDSLDFVALSESLERLADVALGLIRDLA